MKRITYLMVVVIVFCTAVVTPVRASENSELQGIDEQSSMILMERDTGEVIFEKEANKKLPPASMTKVMTLILVMEAVEREELSLDELVTVSERAASMGGSQIFLAAGEEMSVNDLIKGIAIASGNDASVAIAERIAGSEEAFVTLMNEKVRELNLKNTHFVNSSGLPAKNHYSSAADMAMLARELLKHERITDYTSIYEDYLRKGEEDEFWLVNTNKLVHFYPYVDGLKTGFTREAKYCLVATAKREDMRVVAVVMGAETVKERNSQVMKLIDYAFNNYETEKMYEKGETVGEIRNLQTEKLSYEVKTSEPLSVLHKKNDKSVDDVKSEIYVDSVSKLPVKKGSKVGKISLNKSGEVINDSALIVDEEIVKASFFTLFKRSLEKIMKYESVTE